VRVTNFLSAALVGLAIGVLGRLVLPGRQRIGVFVTLLIGVGAAVLGTFVADALNLTDRAPVQVWRVNWDWIVLGIQVGFAVIGTAIAAAITHTRIVHNETPLRRNAKPRKTRTPRS